MFFYDPDVPWVSKGLEGHWCPSVTGPTGLEVLDLTAHNYKGVFNGMDAPTDWVLSGTGYALDLDGTDDYIEVSHRSDLSITGDVVVSAWVYPTSSTATGRIIVSKNSGTGILVSGGTSTYELYLTGLQLKWWDGASEYASGYSLTINTWSHVAAVRRGTTITWYVNGVQVATANITHIGSSNTSPVWIGRDTNSAGQYFVGQIDDVRIYSRTLSVGEIQALASRRGFGIRRGPGSKAVKRRLLPGVPAPMASPLVIVPRGRKVGPAIFDRRIKELTDGMVGYWSPAVTGPTGTDLLDLSGQNNNGTLTNMDAPTDWVRDRYGYALDFDGVNDYISALFPTLELSTQDCTFQSWVKTPAATSGVLVSLGSSSNFNPFLTIESSSPVVGYRNDLGGDLFTVTGGTFTSEWRLLSVVSTPSRTTLYQNGVVVNSVSQSSSTTRTFNRFSFAARNRTGTIGSYAACLISEGIIHNRALTPAEIATLYRLGPGGLGRSVKRSFLVTTGTSSGNRRRRIICGSNC